MSSNNKIIESFYQKHYDPAFQKQQISNSQYIQNIIDRETYMLKEMGGVFWEFDPNESVLLNIVYLCLKSQYANDDALWHGVCILVKELEQDDPESLQQALPSVIDCIEKYSNSWDGSTPQKHQELKAFFKAVSQETAKTVTSSPSDSAELNEIEEALSNLEVKEELAESKTEELGIQQKYQAGWWARAAEDKKTWEDYKELQMTLGMPLAKL